MTRLLLPLLLTIGLTQSALGDSPKTTFNDSLRQVATTNACPHFPGSPVTWYLHGAGFDDGKCSCAGLNKTFILQHAIACNWSSAEFPWCGRLARWNLNWWEQESLFELSFQTRQVGSNANVSFAGYDLHKAQWKLLGPNTMKRVFFGPHCIWPANITLSDR